MTDPVITSSPAANTSAQRIVVLGSLNMDLVARVPHVPEAGETLTGHSMATVPGGKGANQAVSCARQGAQVQMVGCVGDDGYGAALRQALQRDSIDTTALRTVAAEATGVALILVEDSGQNRIVLNPGANASFTVDEAALRQQLQGAAFMVTQFEIPLAQAAKAMAVAHAAGCKVLLNPSPVQAIAEPLWTLIDTLVVNEIEAKTLSGLAVESPQEAAVAGQVLRSKGVARVVVTLGAHGAVAVAEGGATYHPALKVKAVDTTAAGDTFLGALAKALAEGLSLNEAVRLGIRAAALCVQLPGAQPSIPRRDAVLHSPMPPDWQIL
jgi:ribokinase